jgi:TolB protein
MIKRPVDRPWLALLLAAALALCAQAAQAQRMTIDIFGPGQAKVNIIQTQPLPLQEGQPLPAMSAQLRERIDRNLGYLAFLHKVMATDIIGGDRVNGPTAAGIDFKRFQLSRVDLVLTAGWREGNPSGLADVELRAYEVFTGSLLLGKAYYELTPKHVPEVADRFCAELMRLLTGSGDFFNSQIAFVRKEGKSKNIWAARPTGEDLRQLTKLSGIAMSPSWSFDGTTLAFTYVGERNHSLGILRLGDDKPKLVNLNGSSVISPTFLPDGQLAVTMDAGGQPDIFLLNGSYKVVRPLVENWAIDVSPSFDAKADKMAFVSSRLGNPHIFLQNMRTGEVNRVTMEGRYNTEPSLSPDGRLLAFAREMADGEHRIFFYDLATGIERQVTFGPGSDEDPSWAPDGYFLVYASNRTGQYKLYLTTRHGDTSIPLETGSGEAKSPAWAKLPLSSGS